MKLLPREQIAERAECYVAIDSWAGRSYHRIRITQIGARYVRAEWLDDSVFGRVRGNTYRIPRSALRENPSEGTALEPEASR